MPVTAGQMIAGPDTMSTRRKSAVSDESTKKLTSAPTSVEMRTRMLAPAPVDPACTPLMSFSISTTGSQFQTSLVVADSRKPFRLGKLYMAAFTATLS